MEFTVGNLVKWFQLKYPKIVKDMHNASHHFEDGKILNPYHLEGDIWTHNMMVMLEANRLKDKCDVNEYKHVLVAALLHDIGKPLARKVNLEKQRVHFWGHEPMSAFLAVPIIDHIEKDFNVRLNKRLLLETIAMHTEVYSVPREKLEAKLIANRQLATLLGLLSDCDYAGRFFEMGDRGMEVINPKSDREALKNDQEVICYVGLPCSGKSTNMLEFIKDKNDWAILSRDEIVLELGSEKGFTTYNDSFNNIDQKEVDRRFQIYKNGLIKKKLNVVIDMTNMSRKSRRKNLHGFKDYKKSAVVVMTPMEKIIERNRSRSGKFIPEKVYERMITSFQPPLYDEFDDIDWVFN